MGMCASVNRWESRGLGHLRRRFKSLGASDAEIDEVSSRITLTSGNKRAEHILAPGESPAYSTILLEGVAAVYDRLPDGTRQIYSFKLPGDFCDLNRHMLPAANNEVAVEALTACSVGIIEHKHLEELILVYPSLALASWRAMMLEVSIVRKSLLNGRRPALERVAHLLCELLARRQAVGIDSTTIPLSQVDLADAVGLTPVHVNRTFKELQKRHLVSKDRNSMSIVDRVQLASLGAFDGHYLNMPKLIGNWQVQAELDATTPIDRTPPNKSRYDELGAARTAVPRTAQAEAPKVSDASSPMWNTPSQYPGVK